MPLHPPELPDAEQIAWAARLRAVADDVRDVAQGLRRRSDDAGLVGPSGDALRELTEEVARAVTASADAVAEAGVSLLVDRRA